MSATDLTYVIFDGDKDKWAYGYMKGWNANNRIEFNLRDVHEEGSLTSRAQDEWHVKAGLRERFGLSSQVIVVVGESTRYLYKFVRWEIDVALELHLPIIVVNLNKKRAFDAERCPPILHDKTAVHVSFRTRHHQARS